MPAPFTTNPLAYAGSSFMGAKVRSFTTSVSWGVGAPSQLSVQLIDDPQFGAVFDPPPVNTPVFFSAGGLTFNGLFQKVEQRRDLSGNPVYEVVVVDPREVLDGAQIIIGGYMGGVGAVRNLFNAYGYWENQAYGASGATEAGMPWFRVRDAVLAMCSSPAYGTFGGPLTFGGFTYGLDLSELPVPPVYYRLGGTSIGLLEAVAQICEDAGCDFFVELVGSTIVIRTVSRAYQPPLGTISALTTAGYGSNLVRSTSGLEGRNEVTSSFLVGGDVSTLWTTDAVRQFWGYDVDGNPVLGQQVQLQLKDKAGTAIGTFATEQMNLNAAPIADIIGSTSYTCTTLEMRLAQVNYDSWQVYMDAHRPVMAERINLQRPFRNNGGLIGLALGTAVAIRANMVNDLPAQAMLALDGDAHERSLRVYELVRGYADEYMGRKFLAGLPFILAKTDPETLKVTTSWEVTDGGYIADGAEPLGLSALNADTLRGQDGRFRAFVVYGNLTLVDLSKVSPQGAVIENGLLYQECHVDPQLLDVNGPKVVVSVTGPVVERERTVVGDPSILGAVLQLKEADFQKLVKKTALPFKIAPATRLPAVAAVPLKSNVLTYGPWFASGAPGKVRFEQDPSLTPWGFGGYTQMSFAGSARVTTAITNMQISETGTLEQTGLPQVGLGRVLQLGGPNVTAIDVNYDIGGVSTTYRFQTYTQRFGVFGKSQAERFKRLTLTAVELRRGLRAALRDSYSAAKARGDAQRADKAWRARQAKVFKKQTPYDVLHAYSEVDASGAVRVHPALTTMEEAITLASAGESGEYPKFAMMSWGGLFRPFSTSPSGQNMASYTTPTTLGTVPSKATLDPFKQFNDVEVFAYGQDYAGSHAFRRQVTGNDARVFGLRGPLVVVGWGFGKDTLPVPGVGGTWASGYMTRQDTWKAGPVDLLWDDRRGVWTCHGAARGTMATTLPANGSGTMTVSPLSGASYDLPVFNHFGTEVPVSKKVVANYIADDNRWYVIAADC